jgi:mono/diheme cytochrome c family protein
MIQKRLNGVLRLAVPCLLGVILAGCKASEPGRVESAIVKEMKQSVTIGGKGDKNPFAAEPAVIEEGARQFQQHCGVCHGLDGQNTGIIFAERMSPPVPDLKSPDVQEYTDGQLRWIIANGIAPSGMPAWKGNVSDDVMWKMVVFIRNLPAKGSQGVPRIYQDPPPATTGASEPAKIPESEN